MQFRILFAGNLRLWLTLQATSQQGLNHDIICVNVKCQLGYDRVFTQCVIQVCKTDEILLNERKCNYKMDFSNKKKDK